MAIRVPDLWAKERSTAPSTRASGFVRADLKQDGSRAHFVPRKRCDGIRAVGAEAKLVVTGASVRDQELHDRWDAAAPLSPPRPRALRCCSGSRRARSRSPDVGRNRPAPLGRFVRSASPSTCTARARHLHPDDDHRAGPQRHPRRRLAGRLAIRLMTRRGSRAPPLGDSARWRRVRDLLAGLRATAGIPRTACAGAQQRTPLGSVQSAGTEVSEHRFRHVPPDGRARLGTIPKRKDHDPFLAARVRTAQEIREVPEIPAARDRITTIGR